VTANESNPGGGATPQEAFEGFRDAMADGDPSGVCRWVPPVERNKLILGVYVGARFMADFDEELKGKLDAIAEKHGAWQPVEDSAIEDLSDPEKTDVIGARMLEKVDAFAYLKDLLTLSKPADEDSEDPPPGPTALEDVKIDGDTARAALIFEGEREEIRFVRVEDRWYVLTE